ncbi:MAG: large subunit ribosomal protein L21 [Parcubacteria group bacterium Greene0714_21]|nr:MAG: large subunit ribosomal protein L21 [Parcubacteria group bacterium Greene0416_39]TSC97393.1 MAG: large subunit ribosomal protein L21 [Parcubacteria group bacterium Greene1014_47]TSD03858.1 MAG: large subunit ribosomal protein L21 [Parcubacteria group bacterium Greene0714_21]
MLAVIKTGGKQYIVAPGQKIKIEKLSNKEGLPAQAGEEVVFDEVLLVKDGENVRIGTPFLQGARVQAKVLKQGKGKKLIVFKFKPKKKEKRKQGHRQLFTEVEIISIESK